MKAIFPLFFVTVLASCVGNTALADPMTADETTLFIMDCETNLKLQLDDPASYARLRFDPITQDAGTLEEFMGIELPDKAKLVEEANAKDDYTAPTPKPELFHEL